MANITNNYSTALGQGGFAIVYLGTLSDTQVAVKLLNQNSTLTIFQSEASSYYKPTIDFLLKNNVQNNKLNTPSNAI